MVSKQDSNNRDTGDFDDSDQGTIAGEKCSQQKSVCNGSCLMTPSPCSLL